MRIYKIISAAEWTAARRAGSFVGSPADLRDGYIHLSTASQAPETFRRHFLGQSGLLILAFSARRLGTALRWEVSRGGELFPHLYGPLDCSLVDAVASIDGAAEEQLE